MIFSWSAPQFTAEDEQREREALTPSECEEIEHDICGIHQTPQHEESIDEEQRRNKVCDYVRECIAPSDKGAYLQALEQCPNLVEQETNPLLFLNAENNQIEVRWFPAETCLLMYTQCRISYFPIIFDLIPLLFCSGRRSSVGKILGMASQVLWSGIGLSSPFHTARSHSVSTRRSCRTKPRPGQDHAPKRSLWQSRFVLETGRNETWE